MTVRAHDDARHQRVLVVGPNPRSSDFGGLDTHVRNMERLSLPASLTFYDPGSWEGGFGIGLARTIMGALRVGSSAANAGTDQVWINASIYPASFVKCLLALLSLRPTSEIIVRVFFHGGRFKQIGYLRSRGIRAFCTWILRRATSVHLLSLEQGRDFAGVFPGLAWELYANFLPETDLLPPAPVDRKVFLYVGRLVAEKGVRDIVSAVELLSETQAHQGEWQVWLAGDGPELEALREQASKAWGDTIKFLGPLAKDALESAYQSAFALLLPSYSEGFPYVVIEAMRAGLPVICSETGALPDVVVPGENGLFVTPGDIQGMANAMRALMDDEPLAQHMSANNSDLFLSRLSRFAAEKYYSDLQCPR